MPPPKHIHDLGSPDRVSEVALRALCAVVPEVQQSPLPRRPLETYLSQLTDAVLHADPLAAHDIVRQMRRAKIASAQIAEIYIPEVARRLGDAWLADTLEFGAVTIGSARLQGLLRSLSPDWCAPVADHAPDSPTFLVGVPAGSDHTMGAIVLAGQMRHRGLSVHLDLQLTVHSLSDRICAGDFAGVLLSLSSGDHLETLTNLVDCARAESRNMPVIVGGAILEQVDHIKSDVRADLFTCDVHEAIRCVEVDPVYASEQTEFRRAGE